MTSAFQRSAISAHKTLVWVPYANQHLVDHRRDATKRQQFGDRKIKQINRLPVATEGTCFRQIMPEKKKGLRPHKLGTRLGRITTYGEDRVANKKQDEITMGKVIGVFQL